MGRGESDDWDGAGSICAIEGRWQFKLVFRMTLLTQDAVVILIASAIGIDAETLRPETRFMDLPIDSLEFMQLVKDVESDFNITITDQDVISLNTVGDLVALVGSKN